MEIKIAKYLEHGLKIGMGVDGEASADIANPFENMRMGLYFIRASYGRASIMQATDILGMVTMGSTDLVRDAHYGRVVPPGASAATSAEQPPFLRHVRYPRISSKRKPFC